MTTTEITTFLRGYNEWRRGNEDLDMPDPKQIGEALDAAAERLEKLDAAICQLRQLATPEHESKFALMNRIKAILSTPCTPSS